MLPSQACGAHAGQCAEQANRSYGEHGHTVGGGWLRVRLTGGGAGVGREREGVGRWGGCWGLGRTYGVQKLFRSLSDIALLEPVPDALLCWDGTYHTRGFIATCNIIDTCCATCAERLLQSRNNQCERVCESGRRRTQCWRAAAPHPQSPSLASTGWSTSTSQMAKRSPERHCGTQLTGSYRAFNVYSPLNRAGTPDTGTLLPNTLRQLHTALARLP